MKKAAAKKIKFQSRDIKIFLRSDADESVAAEIFNWQEYRAAEDIIRNTKLPILDIGAHIGIFCLYAKALNPLAEIYVLEPEKNNFEFLEKNLKANSLTGIKIFKAALAGRTEKRKLMLRGDNINHCLLKDGDKSVALDEKIKSADVQAYSLQDFLLRNSISRFGLVKMDVEGGEYEIFENLQEDDFEKIQNIILEYHNYNGRNYKEIEAILRRRGFGIQIFPSQFDKDLGFMLARNRRSL